MKGHASASESREDHRTTMRPTALTLHRRTRRLAMWQFMPMQKCFSIGAPDCAREPLVSLLVVGDDKDILSALTEFETA